MNTTQNKTRTKYKIKLKHNLNTYKAKKSQNTLFGNNINTQITTRNKNLFGIIKLAKYY